MKKIKLSLIIKGKEKCSLSRIARNVEEFFDEKGNWKEVGWKECIYPVILKRLESPHDTNFVYHSLINLGETYKKPYKIITKVTEVKEK